MSYSLYVNKDNPYGLWMLDDATPFQDHSGRVLAANVVSGSTAPTTSVSVVASAAFSSVFDNSHKAEFTNKVYTKGYERVPFSIEAWLYPVMKGASAPLQVASNAGIYDGLTLNGTVVRFAVAFASAGMAVVDYDIQQPRGIHVQCFYTGSAVQLFIDGERVGETELTDSQKNDVFVNTNGKLYSGLSTSTNAVALNALAFYANTSSDKTQSHYLYGKIRSSQDEVAPAFGGEILSLEANNKFIDYTLSTTDEFSIGTSSSVSILGDEIRPSFIDDVSIAGSWTFVQPIVTDVTTAYAVVLDWIGVGAVVQTSLDNATWTTASKNVPVTSLGTNFTTADKTLWVKVSFAGGVLNDESFLDNFRILGYKTNSATASLSRPVSLTNGAVVMENYEATDFNERNGVRLNGGTMTIAADANGTTPKTIEVWIKKIADTIVYSTPLSAANTYYVNGAAGTSHLVGEWVVRHFVVTAGHTGTISITGDAIVGQVVLYPNVLTAAQVLQAYQSYTGRVISRVVDSSPLFVVSTSDSINAYSHDWEIVGAE